MSTGLFISRDPAGFIDGPNVYTYVKQNPWTSFDPEGLWAEAILGNAKKFAVGAKNAVVKWTGDHPRTMGVVQGVGGVLQGVAGIAGICVPEPTMLTKVAGITAAVHGLDDIQAGFRQAWTGQQAENFTTQGTVAGAKALGASDLTASNIATGVNLAAGLVAPTTAVSKAATAAEEVAGATAEATQTAARATGNIAWPPNRGFLKPPDAGALQLGSVVDRFGGTGGTIFAFAKARLTRAWRPDGHF